MHSGTVVNKEMPAQESQQLLQPAEVPAGEDEGRSITLNSGGIQNLCMEEGEPVSKLQAQVFSSGSSHWKYAFLCTGASEALGSMAAALPLWLR